jgi:hypothetical protein
MLLRESVFVYVHTNYVTCRDEITKMVALILSCFLFICYFKSSLGLWNSLALCVLSAALCKDSVCSLHSLFMCFSHYVSSVIYVYILFYCIAFPDRTPEWMQLQLDTLSVSLPDTVADMWILGSLLLLAVGLLRLLGKCVVYCVH